MYVLVGTFHKQSGHFILISMQVLRCTVMYVGKYLKTFKRHYLHGALCASTWLWFCSFHFGQGSSVRLGANKGLGGKYMRFVILKVRNLLQCTVSRGPLYVIAHSSGSWDWPMWLNKPCFWANKKFAKFTKMGKILEPF